METPSLSKMHEATAHLSKALRETPLCDDLEVVENHQRVMLGVIAQLTQHIDIKKLPQDVQLALSDLGVDMHDAPRNVYASALLGIAEDLKHPRHAPEFFAKYDRIMPIIVAHDLASHAAINQLGMAIFSGNGDPREILAEFLASVEEIEARICE